jgi:hypothetical protein
MDLERLTLNKIKGGHGMYYYLYYWSKSEKDWCLQSRYPIKDDRVHASIVSDIVALQEMDMRFKIKLMANA